MLNDAELTRLCTQLALTAEAMGHAVSATAAAMMADDLSIYPLPALERALKRVRAQHTGKLTLKAVLDQLETLAGRLAPSEAWALALKSADEAATVVWSDEIQRAFEQARGMLAAGDKVGARMAFIAVYERITTTAREQRQLPVIQVSIGWDGAQRQEALTQAVSAGLLPPAVAAEHLDRLSLPAPVFNPVALLEGKPSATVAAPPELRVRLDDLRDQFARKAGRFTKAQVQARAEGRADHRIQAQAPPDEGPAGPGSEVGQMIQPLDTAFFGKVVPLAGQRKPPTKSPITRLLQPHLDRMSDGRYMHRVTMENRCGNTIEVGARRIYVMDEFGDTVLVDDWGHSWY